MQKRLRTFTCFGKLPKELRDYIWELAIQNDKDEALVHFFSASDEPEPFLIDADADLDPRDTWWRNWSENLRAPTWKPNGAAEDWASHRNPFGYLLDPGLWLACTESRECMARQTKEDVSFYCVAIKVPAKKGSSWQRHLVTRFDRDLFVIQMPTSRILSLPLGILEDLTGGNNFWSFMPFCGIEYDPEWTLRLGEEDDEGISKIDMRRWRTDPVSRLLWEFTNFCTTAGATHEVWLVDHHTLRPAAGMTCAELARDRLTFKVRGWRYFEVRLGDLGDRWEVAEGFEDWQTPWHFRRRVKEHPDYVERMKSRSVGRDSAFRNLFWNVAACIKEK